MTETTAAKAEKPKKFRSPNYPFIGLQEALKKAEALQKSGGLHEVPFRAAMEAWDYKVGSTQQTIAALKSFGLVTVTGAGDARKVKLTETARKILSEHSERPELLKAAALGPTIYKDLWNEYKGDLPPSDKVMAEYLEFDKKFNPDVIKAVIKDFRATIAYAKLSVSDILEGNGGESIEDDLPEGKPDKSASGGVVKPKGPVLKKNVVFNITIDVLDDGQITVVNGGELTSKTMTLLKEVFDLKEKHEVRPEPLSETEERFYEEKAG